MDVIELQRRQELFNQGYWEIPDGLDTSNFDFTWRPDAWDRPYIHEFGTQWQKTGGPRFVIPENEGVKYQTHQHAIRLSRPEDRCYRNLKPNVQFDYSWHPDSTSPPYIYVFGNQWYDSETMPTIQYRVKGATEKKYVTDVRATLAACMDRWIVPDDISSDFDFSWVPHPYDPQGLDYQFGTQWQKTGGPLYKTENSHTVKYVDVQQATKLPNKYNRSWRPIAPNATIDYSWHPDDTEPPFIYVFGNQWYDAEIMPTVQYKVPGATEKKYVEDISALLLPNKEHWVVPDYVTEFDFSWVPNPFDPPYEHQFGTQWHYTAGPLYVPEKARGIKYHTELVAETRTNDIVDVIECKDSLMDALRTHKFNRPFVHIKQQNSVIDPHQIIKTNDSLMHVIDGIEAICSKRVVDRLFDKLSDYSDLQYHCVGMEPPLLDIIFFSNGERCAEENYQALLDLNLTNRIVHVKDVQGRVASQHAAANASNTEWYFLVNAKLKVNPKFDFRWQPDVLKSRRHYIFRASNPVNGLEYGHMAIVANNKTLTLNTKGRGLDFTLDSPTEVVDINCGVAVYNSSEWDTWRTAFREVIKLCYAKDRESKKRLEIWTSVADGNFAQNSLRGARDAVEYYESVNGDFEKLKLSYDWAWLKELYNK